MKSHKSIASVPSWVLESVAQRKQGNLFRQTMVMESGQAPIAKVGDKQYLMFCGNDYLGLANHPKLLKGLKQSAAEYGVGSGASHLVNGHNRLHQSLEEELAQWLGYERVMLFSTGYMANLGVISALTDKNDLIVQDKLNHASLLDGAKLSGAKLKRYLHKDSEAANRILQQNQAQHKMLATDGVFSMDGDIAPLDVLSSIANEHDALFMVDDAHGLGCFGENGVGSIGTYHLTQAQVPLLMGTFGKAFGTSGAFVATSNDMADFLTQFARPYIYTTAMSPAIAGATKASLSLIRGSEGEDLRAKLDSNIATFRTGAKQLGLTLTNSRTAIQPILVGESHKAIQFSEALKKQGVWCTAIRPPTVANGRARLRVTLSAQHTHQQIDVLLQALSIAIA
ncbi:8-amino-7-oxononanoate synthase [Marinomonas agarivorans]|nr:8-amino-7-oxononanoate synthase [Marinomonas agarivorans]